MAKHENRDNDNNAQSADLEHSRGGRVTRDDALDLGVPMLPGDPSEPQGPEDALGEGPTRGDYSDRIGDSNYQPHQAVPVENPEPGAARVRVVNQRENVKQGEVAGKKGGVNSAEG